MIAGSCPVWSSVQVERGAHGEGLCLRGLLHHVDVVVKTLVDADPNILQVQLHVKFT